MCCGRPTAAASTAEAFAPVSWPGGCPELDGLILAGPCSRRVDQGVAEGRAAWGECAMGGRHESPKPGTDMFMAVVVAALLALLAAVVIPALLGG